MSNKKTIVNLVIANLIVIFFYIIGRFQIVQEFIEVFIFLIFTPIVFGIFLFYILKPLNKIFIKKRLKPNRAAMLTLVIFLFISFGFFKYFGDYAVKQIIQLKDIFYGMLKENELDNINNLTFNNDNIRGFFNQYSNQLVGYIDSIILNLKEIFNKGMMVFSNIILVLLITFCLLKDGDKFPLFILDNCPKKYKRVVEKVLKEGNKVLSTYIIGQGIVALSLSIMVFIGYKIIGMPGGSLLAFTTFILAFIPFVGFFISMIVPYIIAIALGVNMVIKLTIMFLIAQTLKGRIIVPLIMGRAMKIHPITDIFLVIGGAAIGGPIVAFTIIPIYALLKVVFKSLKEYGFIKKIDNIEQ